jgi:hypothetical protein
MKRTDPTRVLFLGIGEQTHKALQRKQAVELTMQEYGISRMIVRLDTEEVVSWILSTDTGTK